MNNRVISQKSIFFQSPKGYLDEEDYAVIPIPKETKQPTLDYLRKYYGITKYTIYNDIFGYIQNQKKHQSAYTEFYIGLTFQDKGKYEEAIKHYDKAIRSDPQDADAYNNRGNAKFALGLHRDAIADCDRAIRLNPQYAAAYYNRGAAKRELGKHDAAITDHNEAIRINPQFAAAYNDRGIAKGMLGRYEEAIADFNEAIRINPQFAAAYCNRGNANKEIGEYEKARADFQRALELAMEQGNQQLAQAARKLLDELPPPDGRGAIMEGDVQ